MPTHKLPLFILFVLYFFSINIFAQNKFDQKHAFLSFFNESKISIDQTIHEYIFINNNEQYYKTWDNEFEYQELIETTMESITQELNNLDSSYYTMSMAEFGQYNFDDEAFTFESLNESTYITVSNPAGYHCKKCNSSTTIDLYFVNASLLKNFAIDKSLASNMIKERRKSSGEIDRKIAVKIYFTLTDNIDVLSSNNEYQVNIYSTIKKVEFIDRFGFNNNSGSGEIISSIVLD